MQRSKTLLIAEVFPLYPDEPVFGFDSAQSAFPAVGFQVQFSFVAYILFRYRITSPWMGVGR